MLDTEQKRRSALNFGFPVYWVLPTVDGAIDNDDAKHLLNLYSGFAATGHVARKFVGLYANPVKLISR